MAKNKEKFLKLISLITSIVFAAIAFVIMALVGGKASFLVFFIIPVLAFALVWVAYFLIKHYVYNDFIREEPLSRISEIVKARKKEPEKTQETLDNKKE